MYLVLLFAAAALLGDCSSANVGKYMRMLAELERNLEPNGPSTKPLGYKTFLKLTHRMNATYVHKQGDPLHLVCGAMSAPAPSIHWFRNDAPVYEYDVDSNEIIDNSPTSVARLTSTLIVTRSSARDVYTCLVTAGSKTARDSTVVYSTDSSTEISERSKLYPLIPRVVVWYKVYLETIGNNVVLPCRVKGHPRPFVSWRDNNGTLINNDQRMKVLRSGELVISSIRWTDMGEYRCVANNLFGVSAAATFLYPAKPS